MTVRMCACGCGAAALPGSKYASTDRCRQRAYRQKVKDAAAREGVPTHVTLSVLGGGTRARIGDAPAPARKPTRRTPDMRVNYRKAVAAVAGRLQERFIFGAGAEALALEEATIALRPLLSARQQRELDRQGAVA